MKVVIRQYKKLSPRLFELMYEDYTFPEGGLRSAMNENRIERCWLAFDGNKIIGWAGLYRGFFSEDSITGMRSVGVWVIQEARHCGIGNKLRRKALLWSLRNKNDTTWYYYDGHLNAWFPKLCAPNDAGELQNDLDAFRLERITSRTQQEEQQPRAY